MLNWLVLMALDPDEPERKDHDAQSDEKDKELEDPPLPKLALYSPLLHFSGYTDKSRYFTHHLFWKASVNVLIP